MASVGENNNVNMVKLLRMRIVIDSLDKCRIMKMGEQHERNQYYYSNIQLRTDC